MRTYFFLWILHFYRKYKVLQRPNILLPKIKYYFWRKYLRNISRNNYLHCFPTPFPSSNLGRVLMAEDLMCFYRLYQRIPTSFFSLLSSLTKTPDTPNWMMTHHPPPTSSQSSHHLRPCPPASSFPPQGCKAGSCPKGSAEGTSITQLSWPLPNGGEDLHPPPSGGYASS